jgi:hypothetical protein
VDKWTAAERAEQAATERKSSGAIM